MTEPAIIHRYSVKARVKWIGFLTHWQSLLLHQHRPIVMKRAALIMPTKEKLLSYQSLLKNPIYSIYLPNVFNYHFECLSNITFDETYIKAANNYFYFPILFISAAYFDKKKPKHIACIFDYGHFFWHFISFGIRTRFYWCGVKTWARQYLSPALSSTTAWGKNWPFFFPSLFSFIS